MNIDWTDPLLIALALGVVAVFVLWRLLRAVAVLSGLDARLSSLSDTQNQLAGGLGHVAQSQTQVISLVEARLADMGRYMGDTLAGNAQTTASSMGALRERLQVIDAAQAKIEALSGNVLSLQDILSNKQARGAFGEVQLEALLSDALPPDAFSLQASLSNGRRVDALIHMAQPLAVDAKFPLEAYQALTRAPDDGARMTARRALAQAMRAHIKAISERYILPGETADGALMFLPSEAIYAELHANLSDVVREGFVAKVWIVSPTTMMATLNTLRAVMKDTRLRSEARAVRREVQLLVEDAERVAARVAKLESHFAQVQNDLSGIRISADKITRRGARLDDFDFTRSPE
ncbi:DNA recombination protein RmuC [Roseinatronobacter sp. S2]|uniref:DNA recombination protein RmuC n=1 Tax=Roseinatronobacter sp. S2 TaxID=3035471 RepID=UPI00240EF430|nr:DNA recombination protein RmuC [Roseinatronobacter sp. S2]WFE73778.1 DNA recombination protein RmuC [Roseinatronobacter sp. S2]